MPEAGVEKTMDEILEQVQREYAQEARAQTYVAARDAAHENSTQSPEELPNWEKLTPHEIEQARQHVAREREAVLSRHAAELRKLDNQQAEIDQLERLLAAFAEKHGASG